MSDNFSCDIGEVLSVVKIATDRKRPGLAVACKITTGLAAQFLPPVTLHQLRLAIAERGHVRQRN